MPPQQFISKWRDTELKERSASQSHFNDLCALLGVLDPISADPRAQAIATAATPLNELRENWLNPPDLVVREPEVVPGYPDRILPKDEAAAKALAKRRLTNLYNSRPAWLDHAHRALDEAVADAYGWVDDFRAGLLTDDDILSRLFRLNQERSST